MSRIFCLLVFFLCLSACGGYGQNVNIERTNTTELVGLIMSGEIIFRLDSLTSDFFVASQYIPEMSAYSFLSNRKEINIYDYQTGELLDKIPLKIPQPTSYAFIGTDSVLILDYESRMLSICDTQGEVSRTFGIDNGIKYPPLLSITGISPVVIEGEYVSLFGKIGGGNFDKNDDNRKVLTTINTSSMVTSRSMPYPEIYEKNWGRGLFSWVYGEYNSNTKRYIFSFPADHYIYVMDSSFSHIDKYYCGSTLIESTQYLRTPKRIPVSSYNETRHFVETDSYSRIVYDSYNNVYYRFAELKSKYEGVLGWKKDISVIIMDENFRVIGETYIGKLSSSFRYGIFVNENGLHLPKDEKDENVLVFHIYKLSKK